MPSRYFGSRKPANPHLVQGSGGLSGEMNDLRKDIDDAFAQLESGGFMRTEEFTAPAAASANYFKTAFNGSTSRIIYKSSSAGHFAQTVAPGGYAREILIVRSNTANAFSTSPIIVRGLAYGERVTLTFVQANDDGNDTLTSTERIGLDTIEEVEIPPNLLTTGTFTIGYGAALGLFGAPRTRAGLLAIHREVLTGALVAPPTATVSGRLITPAAAPNGARNYAFTYEG